MARSMAWIGAGMCCWVVAALPVMAQQPIFYPAKGQSAQQQNRDQGECQVWAQQSTGINPANLPPPQAPQQTGPAVGGGERLRGAARGAIVGESSGKIAATLLDREGAMVLFGACTPQ